LAWSWGLLLSAILVPAIEDIGGQSISACLSKDYIGVACPGCGITSSVRALLQGNLVESFEYNFAGPFVAVVLLARGGYMAVVLLNNRLSIPWYREVTYTCTGDHLMLGALVISWLSLAITST